jgi:Ca-activated chloride channel homolog
MRLQIGGVLGAVAALVLAACNTAVQPEPPGVGAADPPGGLAGAGGSAGAGASSGNENNQAQGGASLATGAGGSGGGGAGTKSSGSSGTGGSKPVSVGGSGGSGGSSGPAGSGGSGGSGAGSGAGGSGPWMPAGGAAGSGSIFGGGQSTGGTSSGAATGGGSGSGGNSGVPSGVPNGGGSGSGGASPGAGGAGASAGGTNVGDGGAAGAGAGGAGGAGSAGEAGSAGDAGAAGSAGEAGAAGSGGGLPAACLGIDMSMPQTIYVSADDSNSMASATLARKLLRSGQNPPPNLIRTYEFLNYYNVPYEAPPQGSLALVPQMRPAKKGGLELQIGVQSPAPTKPRRTMNLTLVLDTSGSMAGEPMALQQQSLHAIASSLRSGDIVSMTTWNTTSQIPLSGHVVGGPSDPALLAAIDALTAGGGTDLQGGLVSGYGLAKQNYSEDCMNRVVVISDGMANIGITDEQMIAKESDVENKEGIYLVGVGVGAGVNDTLLNVVTDAGNGAYIYIDSAEEAQIMFGQRFDEAMDIAARDVQISMTIPWYLSIAKFEGEQFSKDPSKVKPQNLAPGDAMVVNQTLKPCDPSVVVDADPMSFKLTWLEPLTYQKKTAEVQSTVGELLSGEAAQLRRGRAIVGYADALKTAQLGCSARAAAVAEALALVNEADPAHSDSGLNEIAELLVTFEGLCF